ncbi:MAG: hypothetical protein PVJ67_03925 [Candidatus Pacearchaeota archaeon]|jgi:hypothetical protein
MNDNFEQFERIAFSHIKKIHESNVNLDNILKKIKQLIDERKQIDFFDDNIESYCDILNNSKKILLIVFGNNDLLLQHYAIREWAIRYIRESVEEKMTEEKIITITDRIIKYLERTYEL